MRRVPEVAIRGADAVTLEVQCQDLLRRPTAQVSPVNAVDLVALREQPAAPPSLRLALEEFAGRFRREIADVPNGRSWAEWLEEMASVPGARVPETVRGWLLEEALRPERAPELVQRLLDAWAAQPPIPFGIGTGRARVVRAGVVPAEATRPATPTERKARAPKPRVKPPVRSDVDPARGDAIRSTALERLDDVGEAGLAEPILVAGIRFRLRDRFPALPPHEVFVVLKELVAAGRVRASAGRYRRAGRW